MSEDLVRKYENKLNSFSEKEEGERIVLLTYMKFPIGGFNSIIV